MKREIAQRWVAALRSGEYQQCANLLKHKKPGDQVRYCCLGVLCELYQQDHPNSAGFEPVPAENVYDILDEDVKGDVYVFADDSCEVPPIAVRDWAGIDYRNCQSLAEQNDNNTSFLAIADIIEKEVDRL